MPTTFRIAFYELGHIDSLYGLQVHIGFLYSLLDHIEFLYSLLGHIAFLYGECGFLFLIFSLDCFVVYWNAYNI